MQYRIQQLEFQSTPLMRGETQHDILFQRHRAISIHSPHTRGGLGTDEHGVFYAHFNPLPSCDGRLRHVRLQNRRQDFNPLPSCEGRPSRSLPRLTQVHFNPLPSCEGRRHCLPHVAAKAVISIRSPHARGDLSARSLPGHVIISIHSPHARGDGRICPSFTGANTFQSTSLIRGETV